jgi:zinc protease
VIVEAPEKQGVVIPDQAKLAAVLKSAGSKDLKAYVDSASGSALLEGAPAAGTVTKTVTKEAIGVTEWELSNGVRVILKPTNFKEDEILFRATSPGGTSLVTDADYATASSADSLVAAGGLGKFSAVDLNKMMSGKIANATPFISELQEGLYGNSSKKDLETMFQMIYLRFTQPRADKNAFDVLSNQYRTQLANQSGPGIQFLQRIGGCEIPEPSATSDANAGNG